MVWVLPARKLGPWSEFPFLYRFTVLLNSGGSNSSWSEFWSEFPHFMGMGVVPAPSTNYTILHLDSVELTGWPIIGPSWVDNLAKVGLITWPTSKDKILAKNSDFRLQKVDGSLSFSLFSCALSCCLMLHDPQLGETSKHYKTMGFRAPLGKQNMGGCCAKNAHYWNRDFLQPPFWGALKTSRK